MSEGNFTAADVQGWLEAIHEELRSVEARMRPLLDEQARLEAREALVRDLLQSFDAPPSRTGVGRPLPAPAGSVGEYVVARAVEILHDEGKPLHINELHRQFTERGFDVPGAGRPVNLIVHLRQSDEIASPQRGIYGLAEQVGPVKARPRKKRATRNRRRN